MKIVADENIACLSETFALQGELITRAGRSIVPADVQEADALIVRSVTRVDEALLSGSRVKFVGSCTIGTDHIDQDYLARSGIRFAYAPGCNARAVAEYVVTALFTMLGDLSQWQSSRVGIVGYGNVGSTLARLLDLLGIDWIAFDPLTLQPIPKSGSFEEVLRCNIISLHVPLTKHGMHATRHWFDAGLLQKLSADTLLINSARGAVIDNAQLLAVLSERRAPRVVLDVFENEPAIDPALLAAVAMATPHIAGYSVQGKERGTWQVYQQFCEASSIVASSMVARAPLDLDCEAASGLRDVILRAYNIEEDDQRLRAGVVENMAQHFDALRKHYPSRHEWSNRRLVGVEHSLLAPCDLTVLRTLGFA